MKTIATLVAVRSERYGATTSAVRSFARLDSRAEADIQQCIRNGLNEEFDGKDINDGYTAPFDKIKEDLCVPGTDEFLDDFYEEGTPVWEYNDGIVCITFVLHLTRIEL